MSVLLFNVGLPMIIPSIVLMVVALLPIVFIEAYVVRTMLALSFRKAVLPVAIANLVSTLIGIPITWFLLMLLEFASVTSLGAFTDQNIWTSLFSVTLGAPWVYPGHNDEKWIILGAMLFLLLPYAIMSWFVEYFVIRKVPRELIEASSQALKRSVGIANLVSYCLLAVFVIAVFTVSN